MEKLHVAFSPKYKDDFWNSIKEGGAITENMLSDGRVAETSSFLLPSTSASKFDLAIGKESVMRKISSVFSSYDGPENILSAESDDIAEFVEPFGSIDIKAVKDDFQKITVNSNKLVSLLRLPTEFISDATFDIEGYFIKRLSKSFGGAEDKAFITGSGENEPLGFLDTAETAFEAETLSFDDVVKLYFSVDTSYRKNAVWLMNDKTALMLRKLKDENGNHLWNNQDNTIFGKPVMISDYMPDVELGAKPIAFGDFSYYWIVKRSPVSVKPLNELFALNGQSGYLGIEFIDGKLIRNDAVKVIDIAEEN